MKSNITIALIGNPNSGKTTLFNQLTGARQQVGNWPGVTVERKSGSFAYAGKSVEVIDLPGVYTLSHFSESAMDEDIARDYILSGEADVLVNVLDASNLERHLYLTAQLLEMNIPMVLAINMMDMLDKKGQVLNINRLSQRLGCPVIPLMSNQGKGVEELKKQLTKGFEKIAKCFLDIKNSENTREGYVSTAYVSMDRPIYSDAINNALEPIFCENPNMTRYQAIHQLEANATEGHWQEDPDIMIASARYTWAHELANDVLEINKASDAVKSLTPLIDQWVLNRFLGIPIFLGMIYFMFLFAIHVGGIFQDFFDMASGAIFVEGMSHALEALSAPGWLIAILAAGVGKGINTTLSFIPVLAAMFFCLSFLEASGYMARAAFVMDRLMRAVGLPGKSLVPMIVGFGCNVPAIMGARTLSDPQDRILTIMMSPFMSCSARLAIFSVFVAAFYPTGGQNIVFMLYVIGIAMAILTGAILRKTMLQGKASPWILELPAYHWPSWRALVFPTWMRTHHFLWRAGKIIVPVCLILGVLNALTIDGGFSLDDANENSLLSLFGRAVTPIFSPMGITNDNWPATVGLMTGTLAKEVVVATLNTLYVQAGHLGEMAANLDAGSPVSAITAASVDSFNLIAELKAAVMTIPEHLYGLADAIRHPLLASVPNSEVSSGVYGEMVKRFVSPSAAFAYLLFVLLYVPCASTMAAIRKELNTRWMVFSIFWSTALAYTAAVLYYQGMTFLNHPYSSGGWFMGIILFYWILLMNLKKISMDKKNAS